jgi:hypothetical protein
MAEQKKAESMERIFPEIEAGIGIPLSEGHKRILGVFHEEVQNGHFDFKKTEAELEKLGTDGTVRDQLPRLEFPLDPALGKYWLTNAELNLMIEEYIKRQGLGTLEEAPPRSLDQLPRIKFPADPAEIAKHKITAKEFRLLIEDEWRREGFDPAKEFRQTVEKAKADFLQEEEWSEESEDTTPQAPRLLELKMGSGPKRPMPEWRRRIRDGEPYLHRIDPDLFADERSDDEEENGLSTDKKTE